VPEPPDSLLKKQRGISLDDLASNVMEYFSDYIDPNQFESKDFSSSTESSLYAGPQINIITEQSTLGELAAPIPSIDKLNKRRRLSIVPSSENIIGITLSTFKKETPERRIEIVRFLDSLNEEEKNPSMQAIMSCYVESLASGIFKLPSSNETQVY
jgi:hypothetical protein